MKERLKRVPWWLAAIILLGGWMLSSALTSANYRVIFSAVSHGLGVTLMVSIIAYAASIVLGLAFGLLRSSRARVAREASTFYIELVRGLPMLVILYYIAFVGAPALAQVLNTLLAPLIGAGIIGRFEPRSFSFATRAVIALTLGYAAFIAEIFRAGIESVDKGQTEAAEALGLIPVRFEEKEILLACGYDVRGLVYALLELADRVQYSNQPFDSLNIQKPT